MSLTRYGHGISILNVDEHVLSNEAMKCNLNFISIHVIFFSVSHHSKIDSLVLSLRVKEY
eukprot:UN28079